MEAVAARAERSKLEAKVFAYIGVAINALWRVYGRELEHVLTPGKTDLKTDLDKCLLALFSIISTWLLPQDAFDAKILLLMGHVFEDLQATLRQHASEMSLGDIILVFDAVVDVTKM
jgi:hypothetical protein